MNDAGHDPGHDPGRDADYDGLARLLRELAGRFGETAWTDKRRLLSLLQDRLPGARRDIRAVALALDERVFEALATCRPEGLALEKERLAANLAGLGLRPDVAMPVVQACAYALGRGALPSGAADEDRWVGISQAAPVVSRAGTGDGWVGVSEAVPTAVGTVSGPAAASAAPVAASGTWKKVAVVLVPAVLVLGFLLRNVHLENEAPQAPTQPAAQPQAPSRPQPVQPQAQPPAQSPAQPQQQPQAQPQSQPQAGQPRFFAGEDRDFGVPPQATLKSDVGTPTPTSIPGARTVYTAQIVGELRQNHRMVMVDALEGQHPQTIQGAAWLPSAGRFGSFNDGTQTQLAGDLGRLTGGQKEVPLVFFCQGPQCWESYNAALRARAAGFPNVFWYRGGLQAWAEAGLPLQPTQGR